MVSGTITSISGEALGNHVACLMIRDSCDPAEPFKQIDPKHYWPKRAPTDHPLDLTDSQGNFQLRVSIKGPVCSDSIAVGILLPGEDIIMGEPFAVKSVESEYTTDDEKQYYRFGCPSDKVATIGHHYRYPTKTVVIP